MRMKKKLQLSDLRVQSFVTETEQRDLIGGQNTPLCNKTLPVAACITELNLSQCPTCGVACTTPQYTTPQV